MAAPQRTWVLTCFKCNSSFEVSISVYELIMLRSRTRPCPRCGHLPRLTRPNDIWSAVEVHGLVGLKRESLVDKG
jgi:hypothetical protein